ncbi:MAG: hypothetical protein WC464_07830 [Bdellovibrionales bacterium]
MNNSPLLKQIFKVVKHEVVYQGEKCDIDLMVQCDLRFTLFDKVIDPYDGSILSIPTFHSYYVALTVENISSSASHFNGIYYKDSRNVKAPFDYCCASLARDIVSPGKTSSVWFIFKVKDKNFFSMDFSIAHDGQRQECQKLQQRGFLRKRYELN